MTRIRMVRSVALVLLLATPSPMMAAPHYVFRLIADNSGEFPSFGPFLSINNRGVVAFKGRRGDDQHTNPLGRRRSTRDDR